jgi:hypothetical protein
MTRSFLALGTVALLISASPAPTLAQNSDNETDEPLLVAPVKPKWAVEAEEAEKVLETFAECVAAKEARLGGSLREFLRVPTGGTPPGPVVEKIVNSDCLTRGRIMMAPELLRQALYAALYRRAFGKDVPAEFVPAVSYELEFDAPHLPLTARQVALRQVGDCATSRALSSAHRFAVAKVRSDEEAALLPDVVQALSECLDRDEEVAFTRPVLKGMLAESLYKYRRGLTQVEMASAE